jgi:hypothetical protein
VFVAPAARPLIVAICTGSAADSFRVKLLSMPQHKHAAAISAAPPDKATPEKSHDSTMVPARMAEAPKSNRQSTLSR